MCYTGLIKRIIPFALTFAAGLFLASFFVSVGWPGENWRSDRRASKFRKMQQLRMENDELREKCRALRLENEELRRSSSVDFEPDLELNVPPPPAPIDMEDLHPHHPPKRDPKQKIYGTIR